jgi:ABC-2 type transport system ATP-binding protein
VTAPIEAVGLTKRFGSTLAVDDLSFTIQPGTVTGFLGPNGAGKTTTLRMVLGLVRPTAGQGLVFGAPYVKLRDPLRRVGAVLEAGGFHPGRSARSHLRIVCTANGLPTTRADEILEMVGLTDSAKRRVGGYSLGMRQRLSLGAALLGDPDVLVLDEPANGLDPEGIRWLREFLRYLASTGKAVLISSHVLNEVQHTVDHVVIIRRGQLVRAGSLNDVLGDSELGAIVRTPDGIRLATALTEAGARIERGEEDRLVVRGLAPETVGEIAAAHNVVLHELRRSDASLEAVFFELTRDTPPDAGATP